MPSRTMNSVLPEEIAERALRGTSGARSMRTIGHQNSYSGPKFLA